MARETFWNTRLYTNGWDFKSIGETWTGLQTRKFFIFLGSAVFSFSMFNQNRMASPWYFISASFSLFGVIRGVKKPTLSFSDKVTASVMFLVTAGLISASPFFSKKEHIAFTAIAMAISLSAEFYSMCYRVAPFYGEHPFDIPDDEPLFETQLISYETQSRLVNFYSKAAWGALIAAFMLYGNQFFGVAVTATIFFLADQLLSICSTSGVPLSSAKKIAAIASYLTASGLLVGALLSYKHNAATAGAICSIIGCAIPTLFLGIRHHLELQPIAPVTESTPLTREATAPAGAMAVRILPRKEAVVMGNLVTEGSTPPVPSAPPAIPDRRDEDPTEVAEQLPSAGTTLKL